MQAAASNPSLAAVLDDASPLDAIYEVRLLLLLKLLLLYFTRGTHRRSARSMMRGSCCSYLIRGTLRSVCTRGCMVLLLWAQVQGVLGQGSYGEVRLAVHRLTGVHVAIKAPALV